MGRQAGSRSSLLPSLQGQLSGKQCLSKREHCQGPMPSRKNLVFSAGTRKLNCVNDRKTGPQSPADCLDLTLLLNKETACKVTHLKVISRVGRQVRSAVVVGVVGCHLWPGVVGHWRVCIFNTAVQCREGRSLSKIKEESMRLQTQSRKADSWRKAEIIQRSTVCL